MQHKIITANAENYFEIITNTNSIIFYSKAVEIETSHRGDFLCKCDNLYNWLHDIEKRVNTSPDYCTAKLIKIIFNINIDGESEAFFEIRPSTPDKSHKSEIISECRQLYLIHPRQLYLYKPEEKPSKEQTKLEENNMYDLKNVKRFAPGINKLEGVTVKHLKTEKYNINVIDCKHSVKFIYEGYPVLISTYYSDAIFSVGEDRETINIAFIGETFLSFNLSHMIDLINRKEKNIKDNTNINPKDILGLSILFTNEDFGKGCGIFKIKNRDPELITPWVFDFTF